MNQCWEIRAGVVSEPNPSPPPLLWHGGPSEKSKARNGLKLFPYFSSANVGTGSSSLNQFVLVLIVPKGWTELVQIFHTFLYATALGKTADSRKNVTRGSSLPIRQLFQRR